MSCRDIRDRLLQVIYCGTTSHRRLKLLEEQTGISSDRWKNLLAGKQQPTADMIQAIARQWPHYALWISTGVTDSFHGHSAPEEGYEVDVNVRANKHPAGERYFKRKVELLSEMEKSDRRELTREETEELYSLTVARKHEDEDSKFDPRILLRGRFKYQDEEVIEVTRRDEHQKD